MLVTKTVQPVNPIQLARSSGMNRLGKVLSIPEIPRPTLISSQLEGCACQGPQLGFVNLEQGTNEGNYSVLGAVAVGTAFIPGVGPIASGAVTILTSAIDTFFSWLGIGKGRAEADIIVPRQNDLINSSGTGRIDQIVDQIRTGMNPSLSALDAYYREVWQLAVGFMEFVALPDFTDRRASGQALNTIMPYIDGTCGYPVPLSLRIPYPAQTSCIEWGGGTLGGTGYSGVLGAIARAITNAGGTPPSLPSIVDSANDGIPVSVTGTKPPIGGGVITAGPSTLLAVGLGVVAIFLFSPKRGS